MFIKKLALGTAAATLVAAPVVAQSAPERMAGPVSAESEISGEGIAPAFIVLAIGAIGIGVLLLTDDDDEDTPISA